VCAQKLTAILVCCISERKIDTYKSLFAVENRNTYTIDQRVFSEFFKRNCRATYLCHSA